MGSLSFCEKSFAMTDTPDTPDTPALPDRLAADPTSPFHDAELLARGIGVRFKGVEKTNVEEYCVSEGWIRVPAGNAKDRRGNPMTLKLKGPVEVYLRDSE
ncbi:glutathione peroxidase [Aureimonas sp. SA4125]|nr:glutathione peroxidase [Aureimonas sp. SA4125]